MKKQIVACCLLFCLFSVAKAQPYKVSVPSGVSEVEIIISNTYLDIEGYNGNEILITSKGKTRSDRRAEGLRAFNQNGVDNTGIGISLEQSNGKIKLLKVSKREAANYFIKVPKNLDLVVEEEEWHGEVISITDMIGAVTVLSNNADVALKGVAGPVNAKSTSGDISTAFSKKVHAKGSEISSISGKVEVYLPMNLPADLDISSISGEVYTDFDLEYKDKHNHQGLERIAGGGKTYATINGGGVKLVLSSISDDVYVRKEGK